MKKLFTLMMTVTVVAVLAACGGNEEAEPATEETPVEVEADTEDNADVEDGAEAAGNKEFTLTATNFEFASDIELVVNKGDLVTINLTNEEGVHGLAIEEFDAVGGPGETIEFEATETGTFELKCAVQCGAGHDDMKTSLVVVD